MMLLSLVMVVFASIGLFGCGETITVELQNGDKKQTLEVNDEFTAPEAPTKTGYTFLGWFLEGSETAFDFNTKIESSIVLVARWEINQYSISFDADGGSDVATIEQDYDTAVSAPTAPTKTGYTFLGWYEEGATEAYAFDKIEARNVALKAKWAIASFSITFNSDGGSAVATIEQEFGSAVVAPANPTKTGYTFAGWFEAGASEAYDFDVIEARNVALIAKWTVNTYSISFDANGGSAVAAITQNFGTAVSAPTAPTKLGYDFVGWFEDGADEAYTFATIEARNVELVARWNIARFTITFNVDGGSAIDPITQDYNTSVSAPVAPTKTGYTFAGWDATIPSVMPAENITITALWTVNAYSISFDANGGSAIATITQNFGTAVSAPANPTKLGYNFAGWFEDGADEAYTFATIEARNVELVARWNIARFTITFNADGGSAVAPITQDYNTAVSAPEAPTKIGYDFVGWFEAGASDPYEFDVIEARNVELIAKWAGKTYTITYDVNGGEALEENTQDVIYGSEFELVVPTHAQYEFKGWFVKDTTIEFTDSAAWSFDRNVELVAKWGLVIEKTYALYKLNDDHSDRVENDEEVVLDGFNNITRAQILEAMAGDPETADDDIAIGDTIEFVLEDSDTAYVVAKITVITGFINDADDLANMIKFADYMNVSVREYDDNQDGEVDRTVTNHMEWRAHLVLTANIDLEGRNVAKNTNPGTLANSPAYGFSGVLDGAGYSIINLNNPLFWQLGNWHGTIKNLSLINASAPLANCLGGVTIDNCYFEFVLDSIFTTSQPYAHLIGHSAGDTYARNITITNTVIKVENNTATKVNVVNSFTETSNVKIENVIVLSNNNVGFSNNTEFDAGVTMLALDANYAGSTDGFDASIWNLTGKHPIFRSFSYTVLAQDYGYGRYILDRSGETIATKVNDADFVATVGETETITISKDVFAIGANGMQFSPGGKTWRMLVKGSEGNYYKATIKFVSFAVNDTVDAANIAKGLNQVNWCNGFGSSMIVMFNNDLDMAGVDVDTSAATTSSYAGSWGFQGQVWGNGRTISNLEDGLFPYINYACRISDLNFVNMKATGALAYKSSGAQLTNVNFDIDAFGMTEICLVNKTTLSRMATTLTDCSITIRNASESFKCYVDYGPNPNYDKGTITLNNVKVTMNAGTFALAKSETTDFDLTGAQQATVVNAVLDKTVVAE